MVTKQNLRERKLGRAINNFLSINDKLAKKYGCKISISVVGQDSTEIGNEVVIADHTNGK